MPRGQLDLEHGSPNQRHGARVEEQALHYLQAAGLRLVARNVAWRGGEIDLIMRSGAELVFVEVRARASLAFGGPAASVTPTKQRKIIATAQSWMLKRYGQSAWPTMRFDVLVCQAGAGQVTDTLEFDWIRAAFAAQAW